MSIKKRFIQDLIQLDDPTEGVWRHLLSIWDPSSFSDISDYYERCEEATRRLEAILDVAYPELYERELPERCVPERWVPDLERPILWMDGLSIREARLLERDLTAELTGPLFSALPSETLEYRKRVNIHPYMIVDVEDPRIPRYAKEIWCRLPDSSLSDIRGRDPPLFTRIYSDVKMAIENVLDSLDTGNLLILSDHGYIDIMRASHISKEVEDRIHEVFEDNRYTDSQDADELVAKGHVVKYGGNYLLKGRRSWTKRGRFQRFIHGGLSLMECIIPCLRLKKK